MSLKEIQENAKCLNMLDNLFGLKNATIADDFSMIDKGQDGFVSKEEGYGALPGHNAAPKTLDRLTCHTNFGGHQYTQGNSPRSCQKCMQYRACRDAANQGKIVLCQCENGKCEVHNCMWGKLQQIWNKAELCLRSNPLIQQSFRKERKILNRDPFCPLFFFSIFCNSRKK